MKNKTCPKCGGEMGGQEYDKMSKYHYDGVSEDVCIGCGARWGRWCEKELENGEIEKPYCEGKSHPRVFPL